MIVGSTILLVSIFEYLNLPAAFGVALLTFALILTAAPYLAGADFGIFKIPPITPYGKRRLQIAGPIILVACIFLFIPFRQLQRSLPSPQVVSTASSAEPPHRSVPSPTPVSSAARPWPELWPNGSTLTVKFMDGNDSLIAKVRKYAVEWETYANVRFAFVRSDDANIRVSFALPGWTVRGTSALGVPQNRPTLYLDDISDESSDAEVSAAVLHEFGHALGLVNEHQSPNAQVPWNRDRVFRELLAQGWSRSKIEEELFYRYPASKLPGYRRFDPTSVMMHEFANRWVDGNFQFRRNDSLSASDKEFIAMLYPR